MDDSRHCNGEGTRAVSAVASRWPNGLDATVGRDGVAALAGYLVLAVILTYPIAFRPDQLNGFGGDVYLFVWDFWWFDHACLKMGQSPLWTDMLYWPTGTSLAFHPLGLPYVLLAPAFRWMLGAPLAYVVACNWSAVLSTALAGWVAYLLGGMVIGDRRAAALVGVTFAASPYRIWSLHIPCQLFTEFVALSALLALRCLRRPSLATGAAFGAGYGLLYWASSEYALYVAPLLAALVPIWIRADPGRLRERSTWRAAGASAAALILCAGPLLWAQVAAVMEGLSVAPSVGIDRARDSSPALVTFFLPNPLHPLWTKAMVGLRWLYGRPVGGAICSLGYATTLLALAGALCGWRHGARLWAIAAAGFLALALGPALKIVGDRCTGIPLPFAWLSAAFPPLQMCRYCHRFFPIAQLCVALLAGLGLCWLLRRYLGNHGRGGLLAAAAASVLVAFESLCTPVPQTTSAVPPAYWVLRQDAVSYAILEIGLWEKERFFLQTIHEKPILFVDPLAMPRVSRSAMKGGLREPGSTIHLLVHPATFDLLPEERKRQVVEQNRETFKRLSLRYVFLYRGLYTPGFYQLAHEVLRRHGPRNIIEADAFTVFEF